MIVKGTSTGTVTDISGKYSFEITGAAETLVFSSVGYVTQEVSINNQSVIDITMEEDITALEEIVVVGYGTQEKVNVTGSVSTIKPEELVKQPVFQTSQGLQGAVSGLVATQTSGQPGEDGARLRIRGIGTLGSGRKNDPLVMVDGVPDNIDRIDPNDIASISVLKDASAVAIYGSRAANGVILITTKRGKSGAMQATFNTWIGIQNIAQNLKFLDSPGYMKAFNDAEPGSFSQDQIDAYSVPGAPVGTEALPNTDWVNELFSENGFQQYYNFGVKGGTESARISATLSYMDQKGNIPNFNYKRFNGRINTDLMVGKKLEVIFDLKFNRSIQHSPPVSQGRSAVHNATRQAYRNQPLFNAYNDDGSWGAGFNGGNPVAFVNSEGLDEQITNYFRGMLKAVYRPIDDLAITLMYTPQFTDYDRDNFSAGWEWKYGSDAPIEKVLPANRELFKRTSETFVNNFNALVNYDKDFGEHSIGALVGYEVISSDFSTWSASRTGFVLPEFRQLNNGDANTQLNSGTATLYGLQSIFGRVNYSFKNRYLFEFNIRNDASSRFAKGYRSSTFPSVSAGWRMSEEGFWPENSFFSELKLRGSWGQMGNQFTYNNDGTVNNFPYTSLFGVGNANPVIGGIPIIGGAQTILANSELQWETGESANIAFDAGFFSNKLSLTAEFYERTTKDILLAVTINPSVGLANPVQNAGNVVNRGVDLDLGWQDAVGEFRYGITGNFTTFTNEITDLGGLDELPPGNTINRVGESINATFGMRVLGLYQESDFTDGALNADLPVPQFGAVQAGDIKYLDLNEDGLINNDDRMVIGNSVYTTSWGLNFNAEFKGFDFGMTFIGASGRDVTLQGDAGYSFYNAGKIQEWQTDYWTPERTNASLPRLTALSVHHNWRTNDTWTFDASYVRFRNLTLGYTLPQAVLDKIKIHNLRIYLSGQNLFTWDHMPDGIDPLVPNFSTGIFYPVTQVYNLGLNLTF